MEGFSLICRCGHSNLVHLVMADSWCDGCYTTHEFAPDNLKYLEMLSKEKEI